ncbi:DNA cytosine methyltransferase [Yersinia kristensenii]|uniref:DNA cytosine methyltransferase n=1 Tax=Yersinia kristensenii TaxID=28152 RepID=UPI001562D7B6|nr:DNA cytosine methyltransferase [Yersinia kristensenii]QKJ16805.1 DNA cytosine methyltransferase [Yersinia kristensenii]HDL8251672.1 DNA cytosine methyltransferase [Yersinia enterocolitica]
MITNAYYNEIDPYAAQWLRNLIKAGHIAPGYVDERSIEDVKPDDLREFTQCHFFAGIGVWSYALRQAGWPDDEPVWTGSCPCQPFSAAGKGGGFDDERHLWPAFFHLIQQRRPPTVFGEQVASKDGLTWLDLVQADLESANYSPTAVDLCAAGFGAPNIRQRLFWVADTDDQRLQGGVGVGQTNAEREFHGHAGECVSHSGLADTDLRYSPTNEALCAGWNAFNASSYLVGLDNANSGKRERQQDTAVEAGRHDIERAGSFSGMADTVSDRSPAGVSEPEHGQERNSGKPHDSSDQFNWEPRPSSVASGGAVNGFWRDADWLLCRDGKWRPAESGTFPLVDGITNRVGRLRAYGNAINASTAEAFIRAYLATPLWIGTDLAGVTE